jgi:hypothetical protein
MDIRKVLPLILFFITVLLIVSLAPQVQTANSTAYATYNGSTEKASMIGLGVIMPWGDILILLSIMVSAGLLTMQLKQGGFNLSTVMGPVFVIISVVFALSFFDSIITSFNTLIAGTTNSGAKIFYGLVLLMIYLGIIGASGGYQAYQYVKNKKKGNKSKAGAPAFL